VVLGGTADLILQYVCRENQMDYKKVD